MVKKHLEQIRKIEERMHDDPEFHQDHPLALLNFIDLFYYFIRIKYPDKSDSYIYHKE